MRETLGILKTTPFALLLWAALLLPPVQEVFHEAGLRWAYVLLFSFFLSFILTPITRMVAIRFNVLDQPAGRKVHKTPTPLLGGAAIYLAFTSSLLANRIFDETVLTLLLAGTIIVAISVLDDARNLSAKLKLLVQVIAVSLVIFSGVRINIFPTLGLSSSMEFLAHAMNIFITFLWVVGLTNAMNFLDGTDGLATGLGACISFLLAVAAFQTGQPFLGWLAIAMMGACLGFLPYNFRRKGPAVIFLGDTGSTFIGFMLACIAIRGDWSEHSALVSIYTPIMIFGVLIFDMTHTTISRIATGKVRSFHDWVAFVGKDHIHHRMYRIFQSNKKTVLLILAINICLGISAIILRDLGSFDSMLVVFQGCLAFAMFSAVNFYQEKTLISLQNKREAFRIHESFDVSLWLPTANKTMKGFVLDISETGAKVLLEESPPLPIGTELIMRAGEFDAANMPFPEGRIVRQREVILYKEQRGYWEYGIRFIRADSKAFYNLVGVLLKKQVRRRKMEFIQKSKNTVAVEA